MDDTEISARLSNEMGICRTTAFTLTDDTEQFLKAFGALGDMRLLLPPRLEYKAMIELPDGFRYANSDDRSVLPEFVILASHGSALDMWANKAPKGVSPRSYGEDLHEARAKRGEIVVYDSGNGSIACLTSFPVTEKEQLGANESPSRLPIIELENMAVPSWNIMIIATMPEARRQGIGRRMLDIADQLAIDGGMNIMSLIVAEGNQDAIRVYKSAGYSEMAHRPMHRPGIDSPGNSWMLMTKKL